MREATLGDVAGDFRKSKQGTVFIADRIDDDVRPEAAAVFADAPTFRLETPLFGRDAESTAGKSGRQVFRRVEPAEILAHDLIGRVALDALRTLVPVGDLAVGIQHINGVVDHRIDEHAEALLSLFERL